MNKGSSAVNERRLADEVQLVEAGDAIVYFLPQQGARIAKVVNAAATPFCWQVLFRGEDEDSVLKLTEENRVGFESRLQKHQWSFFTMLPEPGIGRKVQVMWPDDGKFYPGNVHGFDLATKEHHVLYDDKTSEYLPLMGKEGQTWHFIREHAGKQKRGNLLEEKGVKKKTSTKKVPKKGSQEADPEAWMDHCAICHDGGDLLCCDFCDSVFHLRCVDPPLDCLPEGEWACMYSLYCTHCTHYTVLTVLTVLTVYLKVSGRALYTMHYTHYHTLYSLCT
jgi:hypothetical protein